MLHYRFFRTLRWSTKYYRNIYNRLALGSTTELFLWRPQELVHLNSSRAKLLFLGGEHHFNKRRLKFNVSLQPSAQVFLDPKTSMGRIQHKRWLPFTVQYSTSGLAGRVPKFLAQLAEADKGAACSQQVALADQARQGTDQKGINLHEVNRGPMVRTS